MSKDFPFDRESPLVCEGIIGDGCGGGRIFYIQDTTLFVFDPMSENSVALLSELPTVLSISKKGCIIRLTLQDTELEVDLSRI